uniref:Uncharacterized protein n=1 Tax=Nelumbo nucifera TaxID=4432 RepID=A0A822ZCP3_NELNU|nr:TPA_asm: hypothetical protein HUJ06_013641 [Nelumbo nucifera]
MKATDPVELLSIFPTCGFGKFCSMISFTPRWRKEFLAMAKVVWLLHLLAFAFEPAPCHFQAIRGAEFHPLYIESVIEFSGQREIESFTDSIEESQDSSSCRAMIF